MGEQLGALSQTGTAYPAPQTWALNSVSSSTAAPVYLLVLSTRVNEVHLIQGQGPIRLRDRPNKVNKKISYSKNVITWQI